MIEETGVVQSVTDKRTQKGTAYKLLVVQGPEKRFFNVMLSDKMNYPQVSALNQGATVKYTYDIDGKWTNLKTLELLSNQAPQAASSNQDRNESIVRQTISKTSPHWYNALVSSKAANKDTALFETFKVLQALERWCLGGDLVYMPEDQEKDNAEL